MADTPQLDPGISKLLAGTMGAFVSLRFVQGSAIERAAMAAGGAAFSFYATPPTAILVGMANAEGLVGFLIGLFGMSIIAKVYEALHALDAPRMAADTWDAIKRRIGGGP